MTDFTRLLTNWTTWMRWFHLSNVSTSVENDEYASFTSDDGSYFLRKEQEWWVIDRTNDRGKRHFDIGNLSNFELAEKFLIWRWTSTITTAPDLGRDLYAKGMNPDITVRPTENEWTV